METEKSATGRERYTVLKASGLIGVWKDRRDIGDAPVGSAITPILITIGKEHRMETNPPPEDPETAGWDEVIPDDEKPKTAQELFRALTDNGFIGVWKDRTDIGDSSDYARKLRRRASTRHHDG